MCAWVINFHLYSTDILRRHVLHYKPLSNHRAEPDAETKPRPKDQRHIRQRRRDVLTFVMLFSYFTYDGRPITPMSSSKLPTVPLAPTLSQTFPSLHRSVPQRLSEAKHSLGPCHAIHAKYIKYLQRIGLQSLLGSFDVHSTASDPSSPVSYFFKCPALPRSALPCLAPLP